MITTKLEMIYLFGIFCPMLYPLVLVSINSFIFFYVLAANTLQWNMTFLNFEDGLESFPFQFLVFGILCEQSLTLLFVVSDDGYPGFEGTNQALIWTLFLLYIAMDILTVYLYRKRMVR